MVEIMAFRIHDSVVRGEIDNRVKGVVLGKIWLEGREEPVTLELRGNANPDLAGCCLTFVNPLKRIPHHHLGSLSARQRGVAGDLTASRKVRVMDVPMPEAYLMCKRGEKPPEHMANCLYLEWFSEVNGRVVIESTDFDLVISEPQWRMTPEENDVRAREAAAGMDELMRKLTETIEGHKKGQKDSEAAWDEHDYEKLMKESDARTDKYMELLDKYGDSEEAEEKIAHEMGWDKEPVPNEDPGMSVEEMNAICEAAANEPLPEPDSHREGIDWIRMEGGDLRHPLQHRCFENAMGLWHAARELGLAETDDNDLVQFISEYQTAAVKLAGALDGLTRGRSHEDPGFVVAWLKRALDHLHKAQAGMEAVAPKKLLPPEIINRSRTELFEIRESILKLMDEFRGQE